MLFFLWYYKWTKTLPSRYCYKYLISNGSFGSATAKQVDTDHLYFRNEKLRKRTAQQLVIYHSVLREVHILSTFGLKNSSSLPLYGTTEPLLSASLHLYHNGLLWFLEYSIFCYFLMFSYTFLVEGDQLTEVLMSSFQYF